MSLSPSIISITKARHTSILGKYYLVYSFICLFLQLLSKLIVSVNGLIIYLLLLIVENPYYHE